MTTAFPPKCTNDMHLQFPANVTEAGQLCVPIYCPQCKQSWLTRRNHLRPQSDSLSDELRRWAQPWRYA